MKKTKLKFDSEEIEGNFPYPAKLLVLIATPLKNLVGEPVRYEHTEELIPKFKTKPARLPSGLQGNPRKLPGGTDTKVVIKNEIVHAYQAQYEVKSNLLTFFQDEIKLTDVLDNAITEELEKQALAAIDVENIKIFAKDSGSGVYAGLVKLNLDGAIQQVAISINESGGMTTTIARNSEVEVFVPSFDQRQRELALTELIKDYELTIDKTDQVEPKDK